MLPATTSNRRSRSPQRLVNCYAQQSLEKYPVEILGLPGSVLHAAFNAPGRGLHVTRSELYAVAGTKLYRIPAAGAAVECGTVPGSERLTFGDVSTDTTLDLVMSNGYRYDGSTVAAITDPDKELWRAVADCAGYVVAIEQDSQRWYCSARQDGSDWDALDVGYADSTADRLLAISVDHLQVLLFGSQTIEIWWLEGGSGFPFSRLADGVVEIGIAGTHAVCRADNTQLFCANDRTIRALRSATPVRISSHAVEEALAGFNSVSDCVAGSFTWNGHIFAWFKFPSAGRTFLHSITTGEWSELDTWGASVWAGVATVECYGKQWLQLANGDVGYLSDSSATEMGGRITRSVTWPTIYDGHRRLFHSAFEAELATGDVPAGVVPFVELEYSDDGGANWTFLPRRELGRTGEFSKLVRWHRLGSSRNRVYRLSCSDAVPFKLMNAKAVWT